jgi:hypothetical protein
MVCFGADMMTKRMGWFTFILILLLAGCTPGEYDEIKLSGHIEQVENIESYLATHIGISGFGGEVVCAYEVLNAEQGEEGKMYVWAMCLEYYLEQDELTLGSGISAPVALEIDQITDHYEIVGHVTPRDGTFFGQDVRASFPKSALSQIMPESEDEIDAYNYRAERLEQEIEEKARAHFGD